ncbi:MAG: hypothetical protein UV79_C0003G0006 [candidate division TM6 bacterium GW2011_GWF2_43_17]|nr:MAG: hypothetical protein UV79_C0003G0006 [candidate division TM6 bacterium GW2011_GWF2_43_17]
MATIIPTESLHLTESSWLKTFYEKIEQFLAQQDVAPSSRITYRSSLRQFFHWLNVQDQKSNPTRETIILYKAWLDSKNLRTFTKAGYLVAVRRFFEWTESTKQYPNIAKGVKSARRPTKSHQKDALTILQIQRCLESIPRTTLEDYRDFALINLLIRTGARLIEIRRASLEDLETQEQGATILWIRGKGREGKDDFVVLTQEALKPLGEYLQKRAPKTMSEPLFASVSDRNFGRRLTVCSLSRLIKKRFRSAGIESRRLTAHSLRHTFGVMAIKAGASLYEVQLAMRHVSPATTEVYLGDIEREKRMEAGPENLISRLLATSLGTL